MGTTNYNFPYIATNQASKEVTMNSALDDIDSQIHTVAHASINAQTGTNYNAVLADDGNIVTMNNAAASTFTVASGVFAVGAVLTVIQLGAGQVTLTASGVTFHNPSSLTTRAQYSTVSLIQITSGVWIAAGDLT